MSTVPRVRRLQRYRFWILLPAITMILFDVVATIYFQPQAYWQTSYELTTEKSLIGLILMRFHPGAFFTYIFVYIGVIAFLVFWLPAPWDRIITLAVVIGHTVRVYSWLGNRIYWAMIVMFIIIAMVTVFSWQRAELISRYSRTPIYEGRSKNRQIKL